MMIKRYTIVDGVLVEDENGEVVLFSDYQEEVQKLKTQISNLGWEAEYTRDYYESNTMRRYD